MSKQNNEQKLIRNIDNIINRYLKVDDDLLSSIAKEDREEFKKQASNKSEDGFLTEIVDQYDNFTDQLMERIGDVESDRIGAIKEGQSKLIKFKKRPRKKKEILTARKNNRQKWDKKENSFIKRLVAKGTKRKDIRIRVNKRRDKLEQIQRTDASINNKINKVK